MHLVKALTSVITELQELLNLSCLQSCQHRTQNAAFIFKFHVPWDGESLCLLWAM